MSYIKAAGGKLFKTQEMLVAMGTEPEMKYL
jgi:hypothetical protein